MAVVRLCVSVDVLSRGCDAYCCRAIMVPTGKRKEFHWKEETRCVTLCHVLQVAYLGETVNGCGETLG